jgi:hypothetical protein
MTPGADSMSCERVKDPHGASEGTGEDEGWLIQSPIENAEEDELRVVSRRQEFSGSGEYVEYETSAGRSGRVDGSFTMGS